MHAAGAVDHLVGKLATKSEVQGSNPSQGQSNLLLLLRVHPALNGTSRINNNNNNNNINNNNNNNNKTTTNNNNNNYNNNNNDDDDDIVSNNVL
ncbi:hypothetical protein PoB_002377200 [Plakobranchus ocellatus]|uniref:Uncharacterized protein n=1 Tax=Plakobranchus ocellatus TaxID=259542 RepID=A0AAV3ZRW0_9GAST|nr:hypothetical protein PoB_002377200 [Plakobranchus ocellatus]